MSESDDFKDKLDLFYVDCETAKRRFYAVLDQHQNSDDISEIRREFLNALLGLGMDLAYAKERLGLVGEVAATRKYIIDLIENNFEFVDFGLAGDRLANVGAAYKNDFRPATGGDNESRMQSALLFAARLEQGDSIESMIIEAHRELVPLYDSEAVEESAVAIKQSLKRLRNNMKEKRYYRFDRDSLRLEISEPEVELWDGLPQSRGRPKSN